MNATSKRILSRCDSELSGHNLFLGPYMANEPAMGFVLAHFCQDVHRYADSHKTLSADDDCSFFLVCFVAQAEETQLVRSARPRMFAILPFWQSFPIFLKANPMREKCSILGEWNARKCFLLNLSNVIRIVGHVIFIIFCGVLFFRSE